MSTAMCSMETSMEAPARRLCSGGNLIRRVAGLMARAGVLALGLSLGGVGPVLGSTVFGSPAPQTGGANDIGFVIPVAPVATDKNIFRIDEPESGGGFRETISDPVLWGEWRLFTAGREQLIGFGVLHPGAKPAMMKKRARTLELRLYVPY